MDPAGRGGGVHSDDRHYASGVCGRSTSALTVPTTCGGANNTPAATYHFYAAALDNNDSNWTTSNELTLVVNACAQTLTSIAVTPSPVTVTAGNPADYTTTLTTNGGGGALSATMSVTTTLPTGVTAAFVPNPISSVSNGSTSALTLTTTCGGANNTPAGTYSFTVQAVADTTKTTTATLVVNACAQTLTSIAVTPPSVTVTAGNPADYTTTLTTNAGGVRLGKL